MPKNMGRAHVSLFQTKDSFYRLIHHTVSVCNHLSMRIFFVFGLLALVCISASAQRGYDVMSVPRIDKDKGRFVIDPDGILSESEQTELTKRILNIREETEIEIAVVLIRDYDHDKYEDNRHFGNELFNHWRLGHSRSNLGLLILFLTADNVRKVSFETGDGFSGILTDAASKRIQTKRMLPLLKSDKYYEAIMAGIDGVLELEDEDLVPSQKAQETQEANEAPADQDPADEWLMYLFFMGIAVLVGLYYAILPLKAERKNLKDKGWIYELYGNKSYYVRRVLLMSLFCFPTVIFAVVFFVVRFLVFKRKLLRKEVCPHCGVEGNPCSVGGGRCSEITKRHLFSDGTYTATTIHSADVSCRSCGAIWTITARVNDSGTIPKFETEDELTAFADGEDWKLTKYIRSSWSVDSSSGSSGGSDSGGSSSGGGASSDY